MTITNVLLKITGVLLTITSVSLTITRLVAGVDPNLTCIAPVKPVPFIVTVLAPVFGPPIGVKLATVGCGVGDFEAYMVFP